MPGNELTKGSPNDIPYFKIVCGIAIAAGVAGITGLWWYINLPKKKQEKLDKETGDFIKKTRDGIGCAIDDMTPAGANRVIKAFKAGNDNDGVAESIESAGEEPAPAAAIQSAPAAKSETLRRRVVTGNVEEN